jgi:hypothetical protein
MSKYTFYVSVLVVTHQVFYNFTPLIAAEDSISDKEISKRGYNLILKSNFP